MENPLKQQAVGDEYTMTNTPTIYGYPSALGNLPDDMAYVKEAVLAWRDWPWNGAERWGLSSPLDVFEEVSSALEYSQKKNANWPRPDDVLALVCRDAMWCDCEGFACCYASLAHRALGIDPADIFVTVMHLPNEDAVSFPKGYDPAHPYRVKAIVTPMIHAVCVIRTEGGNKVLDQRAIEVVDDAPDADIVPIFSINLNGEVFWHGTPAQKKGGE